MSDNEQKNESRETIADIVAQKRYRANEIEGAAGRDNVGAFEIRFELAKLGKPKEKGDTK